jgi:CRP/FNR family transcriptional regulator, anaerobic regulatory protein
MTELEQYIQSYFGIVSPDDIGSIVSLFEAEKLKRNDIILQAGRSSNKLYFIQSGLLRVFAVTEDKEVTQWISSKGYFSTDLSSFIFDSPARWTIEALTDSELFSISKENYKKIGKIVPEWNQLEKLFLVRCFTILEDRIFTHLSMTAEERYQKFFETNRELFNQVPLQYLASMLGMTAETFSRIRKKQSTQNS